MSTCFVADGELTLMERFRAGETFAGLLKRTRDDGALWEAMYKRAGISDDALARTGRLRRHWHLLILSEDWCGDSVNVLPYLARLKESTPRIELRIIGRDANQDIMDAHATDASRAIPVVIVLDDTFRERGWWGPRPGPLQSWVRSEGLALPKVERYRQMRTWYARDRGETLVAEILSIIELAEGNDAKAAG